MNNLTIANRILQRIDEKPISDTTSNSNSATAKLVLQYINEIIFEIHAWNSQWQWGMQEYSTSFLPSGQDITGSCTGTITASGTAVTGTGTKFTTELEVGDILTADSITAIVKTITDDTHLVLEEAFSGAITAETFTFLRERNENEYLIPSTINVNTIDVVRINNVALKMVNVHSYNLNRELYQNRSDANAPSYYIFKNKLYLITPPNGLNIAAGSDINITYQLKAQELVENTDVPAIPDDYHWVVVSGAEYKIKKFYNWPDATIVKAEYDDWLSKMLRDNKNFGQSELQMGLGDEWLSVDWTKM